jgi:hypothetical protein
MRAYAMKTFTVVFVALLVAFLWVATGYAQSTLTVNEIYTRGVVGALDWIEIYNSGTTSIDISGYKIYDDGGQTNAKPKKLFPPGTVVPARGFTVIVTDTNISATDSSKFGLSSTGDKVWLENTTGVILDSAVIPALGIDTSYARVPDGSKTWVKRSPLTRGTFNDPSMAVTINEIYSRGVVGALDWIEVYNSGTTSIDISGYKIYDDGGQTNAKPKKLFPAGTVVAAKGFAVIVTDTNISATDSSKFGLSSTGDKVWLENTGGAIIDSAAIPALGVDTSFARKPDGSGAWVKLAPTTKGKTNGTSTAVPDQGVLVTAFSLKQNYPNPFNPVTTITYQVPKNSAVSLTVYDLLGREVASLVNETQTPGQYTVQFNATRLSSGVYLYRLNAGGFSETKKLTLVK